MGLLYLFSLLFHYEEPNILGLKWLGQKNQWSSPGNRRAYSEHFPPGLSPGIPCQQNGHTRLQPLWYSPLLLLKWPALLIFKTCDCSL